MYVRVKLIELVSLAGVCQRSIIHRYYLFAQPPNLFGQLLGVCVVLFVNTRDLNVEKLGPHFSTHSQIHAQRFCSICMSDTVLFVIHNFIYRGSMAVIDRPGRFCEMVYMSPRSAVL